MNLIYLHIGDYCQATARLTPEQDGIYLRLLTEYYKTEKAPVDDFSKLAFLTGCNTKKYQTDLKFVLEHFFVHEPEKKCWLHKRVEREIANYKVDGVQKRYAILCRHWEKANPGVKKPSYEEFSADQSRYYDDTTGRIRIVTGRIPLVLESYGDGSTEKPAPNYPPGTSTQEPDTKEPVSTPVVPKGTPTIESVAESVYMLYPLKVAKKAAIKAIVKVLQEGRITELELQRVVKLYAEATSKWSEQDRTYIPHPATWFNRGSYMDDPATWTRRPSQAEKKGRGAGGANAEPPPLFAMGSRDATDAPEGWERALVALYGPD
ncbi:MAG TPA: YdaU family protein, partial [Prosthecobacter sp.]